jgi:signal transduction histidine kinase
MREAEARAPAGRRSLLGIRGRTVLAVLVPLTLALVVSGWFATATVSEAVARRERERIAEAGEILPDIARTLVAAPARGEFLTNVARALGGDILIRDRETGDIRTTLPEAEAAALASRLDGLPPHADAITVEGDGARHLVLVESIGGRDVALVYRGDPVRDAVARARRPLLLAAAGALVAAALLSFLLASLVTGPIVRLSVEASHVAAGDLDRKIRVRSGDETGRLAAAFNHMLAGLRESRRDLVRAERLAALGRVAGGIAHELRNPLTAIRMHVQMVPEEEDPEQRREIADLLLEEIDRLERTVDDMMGLARPGELRPAEVDASALARETLRLLDRQLEHLGVVVELRVPETAVPLEADGPRIRQVLVNLVLNAAQAMPGGGRASLGVDGDDETVRIAVVDTGPGVEATVEAQLFEPFTSGRADGTGLGLAVSRRIVEAHGGSIAYRREEDRTVFEVLLPRGGSEDGA